MLSRRVLAIAAEMISKPFEVAREKYPYANPDYEDTWHKYHVFLSDQIKKTKETVDKALSENKWPDVQ